MLVSAASYISGTLYTTYGRGCGGLLSLPPQGILVFGMLGIVEMLEPTPTLTWEEEPKMNLVGPSTGT